MSGSRVRELRREYQRVHGRAPHRTRYPDYQPPKRRAWTVSGWWRPPEPVERSTWRRVKRAYLRSRIARPSMDPAVIRRVLKTGRVRNAAVERRRIARRGKGS